MAKGLVVASRVLGLTKAAQTRDVHAGVGFDGDEDGHTGERPRSEAVPL